AVPLQDQDVTVAEVLKQAGYQTGVIGKWGLGLQNTSGTPHRQGFDEWLGYLDQVHAHDYYPTYLWRSSAANQIFDLPQALEKNFDGQKRLYSHDYFTMAATNYIRVSKYRPFFLYLPLTIPHAHPKLARVTGNGMEVPNDAPYANESWPQAEKNKAAMITRLDNTVGAILGVLQALKLDSNTVVFFSSDNGPHKAGGNDPKFFEATGPFRGIKRDLYEGGLRVPMIVWWPGRVEAGKVSDQVWAMWDLMPTLGEVAGARVPDGLDGISMLPTWVGGKQTNQHEHLYWEFHENGFQQAVRMADWKGLRLAPTEPLELYNLKSDPAEETNVAAEHPTIVAKLEEIMKVEHTEPKEWPTDPAKLKNRPATTTNESKPAEPPVARPPESP
ncbi:MAG TPA: arylsulfatase, partial [Verrucomicrobiae bacterium]|nr:arylsulfatase [Verrucomicrobiae bacterium]